MNRPPLTPAEVALLETVFRCHPEITRVEIFGSRAKGTHTSRSDIDLAIWGRVSALRAEAIADELEELPLPYRFDVLRFEAIESAALREHIERVGLPVYPTLGWNAEPSPGTGTPLST
jgi:predicted nucleotidyltransferase